MDTEQSQSSKNTIYIEKAWEDFKQNVTELFLGGKDINFLSIHVYLIFKALSLNNPTYPLRCSPNETSSQKEDFSFPMNNFVFLFYSYVVSCIHNFLTCI